MDIVVMCLPIVVNDSVTQSILHNDLRPEDQNKLSDMLKAHLVKYISSQQIKGYLSTSVDSSTRKNCDLLTPRENEVLTLIAKGCTQKESAKILGLSPATIAGYKKEIYRKLNVTNAAEATVEAIRSGLIKTDII